MAFTGIQGAYAEAILSDADRLVHLPGDFSFEQGAAFPLQGMTGHYLLHKFRRPEPGCFVLVHAAAGGVGGLLGQAPLRHGDRDRLERGKGMQRARPAQITSSCTPSTIPSPRRSTSRAAAAQI